jgi:hypothetical protein
MRFRTTMSVLATASVALASVGTAHAAPTPKKHKTAAKHKTVKHKPAAKKIAGKLALKRSFAQASSGGSEILHWRLKTVEPGLGFDFTNDVWMHVSDAGLVDQVHELRLDSDYAGIESVITQPGGLGDLTGAVTQDRRNDQGPIRTTNGLGYGDFSAASIVAAAIKAANGELDPGTATATTFDGKAAYGVTVRDAVAPHDGVKRNPSEVAVTLYVDAQTKAPLGIQWGAGAELWSTMHVEAFDQLTDTAENQPLLTFG